MYNTTKPYIPEVLEIIRMTWVPNYVIRVLGPNNYLYHHDSVHPTTAFVDHPDGIGTCGVPYYLRRDWTSIAKNAIAMGVNDLATYGASPYKMQVILELPEDNRDAILGVMRVLASESRRTNTAIVGGETAVDNTRKGMEVFLAMSGTGVAPEPLGQSEAGDVIIGFSSNGVHSNGWTKIREIFGDEIPDGFFKPTQYYDRLVLRLLREFGTNIHCVEHITGGAFTRLKKLLQGNTAVLNFKEVPIPPEFRLMHDRGVSSQEMYETFNCGIGMVLFVDAKIAPNIIEQSLELGQNAYSIGYIGERGIGIPNHIYLYSAFDSDRPIF